MEDPHNLSPLWDAIMDIYKVFARVCKENGLRHYVAFGSAIGVLRHGGFIPWDDDLDVIMPRPDYEKLKTLMADKFPPHLRFVDVHNTPEFRYNFGKIMDVRREVIEDVERETGRHLASGVFIDIMPVDGYPTAKGAVLVRKIKDRILSFKRLYVSCKDRPNQLKYKIAAIVGWMLSPFYPRLKTDLDFALFQDKRIKKVPFGSTGCCAPVTSSMNMCLTSQVHNDSDLERAVYFDLNGIKVPLASGYDRMLKARYGDYMRLPPKEHQIPHHYNQKEAAWKYGPTSQTNTK